MAIVEFLLEKGARIDLFCAAMMGQLDAVKAFLTLQPQLIDARGPHGLIEIKKVELKPLPFLKKHAEPAVKKLGCWEQRR
jgi:hypothetical protein